MSKAIIDHLKAVEIKKHGKDEIPFRSRSEELFLVMVKAVVIIQSCQDILHVDVLQMLGKYPGMLDLTNIFKEIHDDLGKPIPESGDLSRWARQGVLLLNSTLTVRAHSAGSHQNHGWEQFTDEVILRLATGREHLVFILWGSYAIKKGAFINRMKHLVLTSPHPSPLSAYRGFFGNKHFSRANAYLVEHGMQPIDW